MFGHILLFFRLGITKFDKDERGIRLETLHLRGVDNMTSKDILTYFKDNRPLDVEWIDKSSCEFALLFI